MSPTTGGREAPVAADAAKGRGESDPAPGRSLIPRDARLALAILLFGVVGYGVLTVAPRNAVGAAVGQWLYAALVSAAAVVIAARAWHRPQERWAWGLVAVGLVIPALRNFLYPAFGSLNSLRPLWLVSYPLLTTGLVVLLRSRLTRVPGALGFDAVIAGLTAAALAAIAFEPFRVATSGDPLTVMLALAFPVGDLLLVAVAAAGLSVLGWRADRRWVLLLAGFVMWAAANILFMFDVAHGTYSRNCWFDALRPLAALLLAAASWLTPASRRPRAVLVGRGYPAAPLTLTAVLVGLLVVASAAPLPRTSVVLAVVGIGAVGLRFALMFRAVSKVAEGHRHAMTDDVTGLGNRRAMSTALTAAAFEYSQSAGVEPRPRGPGLMLLDLNLDEGDDAPLGGDAVDRLLCQVADRLAHRVGPGHVVARVGADEFAVLFSGGFDSEDAEALAGRLVAVLDEPLEGGRTPVRIRASVGVALCPEHCVHPDELLHLADVAVNRARTRPGRVAVCDATPNTPPADDRALVDELRAAIDAGELRCHYQPKVRADGRVLGVEALVRWQHPTRGLLAPSTFLHHAEAGGLMRPLATTVLDLALRQARMWRDRGLHLTVAVNLSMTNLLDADLVAHIGDRLDAHGLPADALILEITENVLASDGERSRAVVEALQRSGVKLSIDDFGTGWSSLARLQEMTVDELKLDGVFVGRLTEDSRSVAIVRSTVALAHSLGASLVAEGVEDLDTLQALRRYGCDVTQGFVHCPPLPADELDRWLEGSG